MTATIGALFVALVGAAVGAYLAVVKIGNKRQRLDKHETLLTTQAASRRNTMANRLPNLGEDFEVWGHWWLPEHEDKKVTGCLSCTNGGIQLRLLGHFSSININKFLEKVPVIHGVGDTTFFTLWNSVQGQPGFRSPGTFEQIFEGMRVLAGTLLPDRSQVSFTAISMHFANIGPWSNLRPVVYSFTAEKPYQIAFSLPEERSRDVSLGGDGEKLSFSSRWTTRNEEFQTYGFDVSPYVKVEKPQGINFEELLTQAAMWQKFFSLMIGEEVITDYTLVEIEGGKKMEHVLDLRFDHMPPVAHKPLHVRQVLVPYDAIKDRVEEIFTAWRQELPKIKDAVDLFLGTIRRRPLPSPTELTSLAQALETFHRNVHGGNYMEVDEYEPIREQLVDAIPTELEKGHRDALRARIKYGYQISFRKRIDQLMRSFDKSLIESLGIDTRTFVDVVVDARNNFTHWDAGAKEARLDGADLSNLVSKLKAFTRLVLLSHIGVPPALVVQRILENKHLYLEESVGISWG